MSYHHGITIKEHRIAKGWTLAKLASKWPTKENGVTVRYVQELEAGDKKIADMETLRKLAYLLDIPLWKLGLSEYDPFEENDMSNYPFLDINSLEELIQDTWYIRLSMPVDITEQKILRLTDIFNKQLEYNPLLKRNKDFLRVYAQVKRLNAVLCTEKRDYKRSLQYYHDMLKMAEEIDDSVSFAIAYTRIGVELLRQDKTDEAIQYLEAGRDYTFQTSKELISLCHDFLARGYAQAGDSERFKRAIDIAINFASGMKGKPLVTNNYVFHSYSGILEEKSNGLILLGQGSKALKVLPEIEHNISLENHIYLNMWIPLDYAQGYMLQGEIEESIKYLLQFYENIKPHKSNRVFSAVTKHLRQLEEKGYGDVAEVKDFKEMIRGAHL